MRTNEEVSEQTLLSLTQTILSCVSSCLQRGEYYYMWFRIKRIKKNQMFQFGTHIGSSHVLVICSFNIIITFELKKIEIDPLSIYLFSICAICKFLKLENWIYWAKRRGSFGNDFSEKLFWWEEYSKAATSTDGFWWWHLESQFVGAPAEKKKKSPYYRLIKID